MARKLISDGFQLARVLAGSCCVVIDHNARAVGVLSGEGYFIVYDLAPECTGLLSKDDVQSK